MSLRSIFGDSHRIKKKTAPSRTSSASSSSSSWPATLPRKKPSGPPREKAHDVYHDAMLAEPLEDHGLAAALVTDLRLRDVPQAVRYARGHMFAPVPDRGLSSTLTARVYARRAALPPVLSCSHLQALLTGSTPTMVERETAELVHAGVLRRVVVPRRGDIGEVLVLTEDYEGLVMGATGEGLDADVKRVFVEMLRRSPGAAVLGVGSTLTTKQLDWLVRAGFLTHAVLGRTAGGFDIFSRPEDRNTLLSLATVARAPSGTVGAGGGEGGARQHAVGSGGCDGSGFGDYRVAVPGAGLFLKMVAAALTHLKELLARLPHREAPEYLVREKWDGGTSEAVAGGGDGALQETARQARRERLGTAPGRTRRWREFSGLRFEWILAEAVGSGMVEVFETGSVGRGVRLVAH